MPDFAFEAFDKLNEVRRGTIQADSRQSALESLFAQGLTVGTLLESHARRPSLAPGALRSTGRSKETKVLEGLLEEWSRLISIGLSIDQALTISCTSHGASPKGRLASNIGKSLREGKTFSKALAEVPGLSNPFVTCIEAGERSGHLPEVLSSLARRTRASRTFSSEIRTALAYPCFVLATTLVLITILVYVVLPSIGDVLTDGAASLPLPTELMLEGAAFIRANGVPIAASLLLPLGCLPVLYRSVSVRSGLEAMVLKLPLAGRIILAIEVSSYLHNLSVQIRGGVSALRAARLCQSTLKLALLRARAGEVEHKVAQGLRFSQAIGECFVTARELPALLRIGEDNGQLAEVLFHAAEHYEAQARHELKVVTSLMTPAVTLLTGSIVGAVVLAMMSALTGLNDLAFR